MRVVVPEHIEALARDAVDSALAVPRALGLLESAYPDCLHLELASRGHHIDGEQLLPNNYRGQGVERPDKEGLHRVLNLDFQTEPPSESFAKLRAP